MDCAFCGRPEDDRFRLCGPNVSGVRSALSFQRRSGRRQSVRQAARRVPVGLMTESRVGPDWAHGLQLADPWCILLVSVTLFVLH